jgi:peptidoglycan/LPS O-acetylase OafA/YrhL
MFPAMQTSLKRHREPMLDGFRAIAVIAVMVYHLPSSPLPGGFLGVDFFFVLSGFLITALLFVEWEETGAISLRAFYARRALRL